jgi:hypothetical protein
MSCILNTIDSCLPMATLITLGSLIDRIIDHYRRHYKELIGITLWFIVAAAPFLLSGYIAPFGIDEQTATSEIGAFFLMNGIGFITTTVASLWIAACLMYTIDAHAKGTTPDHDALGKKSWKAVPSLLILSILIAGILIGLALLAVVPGILIMLFNKAAGTFGAVVGVLSVLLLFGGFFTALYILIRYSIELAFAQFVLVLEKSPEKLSLSTIRSSMAQSRQYVQGRWWATAIRLFIPNAIISLIVVGFSLVFNISTTILLAFVAPSLSALAIKLIAIGMTLGLFIVNAIVMPLYSLATYYLYDSINKR